MKRGTTQGMAQAPGRSLDQVVGLVQFRSWIGRLFGFGVAFVPVEGFEMLLYGWAKIRPLWYWRMQWLRLSLSLVWQRWDEQCTRWSWREAKDIAYCVYPECKPNPAGQTRRDD